MLNHKEHVLKHPRFLPIKISFILHQISMLGWEKGDREKIFIILFHSNISAFKPKIYFSEAQPVGKFNFLTRKKSDNEVFCSFVKFSCKIMKGLEKFMESFEKALMFLPFCLLLKPFL